MGAHTSSPRSGTNHNRDEPLSSAPLSGAPAVTKLPPLHAASKGGHKEEAEALLREGADVQAKHNGCTPLYIACKEGHTEVAELLLRAGADPEAKDNNGRTPLFTACIGGHTKVAELLLRAGADIEARDSDGCTPLHLASEYDQTEVAELLLRGGANKEAKNKYYQTPLWAASRHGKRAVVALLLREGAKKEAKDTHRHIPPWIVGWERLTAVVALLLRKGAKEEAKDTDGTTPPFAASGHARTAVVGLVLGEGADKEAEDKNGMTPLYIACKKGDTEAAKVLLRAGADTEASDTDGATPLWAASLNGRTAVVDLLILRGANKEAKDKFGQTPLYAASWQGKTAVVELLLRDGANKEAKDKKEWTPLYAACNQGHKATAEALLQAGADTEAGTHDGATPLHAASWNCNTSVVALLLLKGANKEAKNKKGATPLYAASANGYTKVAEMLLRAGANTEASDCNGWTPLNAASYYGRKETAEALLRYDADMEAIRNDGYTPLHAACYNGQMAVVELLLRKGANTVAKDKNGKMARDIAKERSHLEVVALLLKAEQDAGVAAAHEGAVVRAEDVPVSGSDGAAAVDRAAAAVTADELQAAAAAREGTVVRAEDVPDPLPRDHHPGSQDRSTTLQKGPMEADEALLPTGFNMATTDEVDNHNVAVLLARAAGGAGEGGGGDIAPDWDRSLGAGSFGRVYYGMWQGNEVAVEVIPDMGFEANKKVRQEVALCARLQQEAALSAGFRHPYVMGALHWASHESAASPQTGPLQPLHSAASSPPPSMETWIVREYCNAGSRVSPLNVAVAGTSGLSGQDAVHVPGDPPLLSPAAQELQLAHMRCVLSVALDIASGMAYLHRNNICHGDLTTENVLLCYNTGYGNTSQPPEGSSSASASGSTRRLGVVPDVGRLGGVPYVAKVSGFGMSRTIARGATHVSTAAISTVTYMCPDLMTTGRLRPACDVYSFGIMLWQIATGSTPYAGLRATQIVLQVTGKGLRPDFPAHVPRRFSSLAEECWAADPNKRPTFEQLVVRLDELLEAADELQEELEAAVAEHGTQGAGGRAAQGAGGGAAQGAGGDEARAGAVAEGGEALLRAGAVVVGDDEHEVHDEAEAHLYCVLKVATEEDIKAQVDSVSPFELVDHDKLPPEHCHYRLLKQTKFRDFKKEVARRTGIPPERQRYWAWKRRSNGTYRPSHLCTPEEEALQLADLKDTLEEGPPGRHGAGGGGGEGALMDIRLFLETPPAEPEGCLLFFKYFEPLTQTFAYRTHRLVSLGITAGDLAEHLREEEGLPEGTPVALYEEVTSEPTVVVDLLEPRKELSDCGLAGNGDIIIYQRILSQEEHAASTATPLLRYYSTADKYLSDVHNRRQGFTEAMEALLLAGSHVAAVDKVDDGNSAEGAGGGGGIVLDWNRKLGAGCSGCVYYGTWEGREVAVKVVPHSVDPKAQEEAALCACLEHPNVNRALHWVSRESASRQAGPPHYASHPPLGMETWIALEFCNAGSLAKPLKMKAALLGTSLRSPDASPSTALTQELALVHMRGVLSVARDIAAGMAYLHKKNICHGDLKADNVLLCYNAGYGYTSGQPPEGSSSAPAAAGSTGRLGGVPYVAKVADFGLSRRIAEGSTHVSKEELRSVGYMCPDLMEMGELRPACDVYSFGIMLWQMATGRTPYEGMRMPQIVYKVTYQGLRPDFPAHVPRRFSSLAAECWAAEPTHRPTCSQLVLRLAKLLEEADALQSELEAALAEYGTQGAGGEGTRSGAVA